MFGTREPASRRQSIVVVKHAGERAGLVVDALLGEFQTVIKPLGKLFRNVDCVSGSSILGNGEVALILDVPSLVKQARRAAARRRGRLRALFTPEVRNVRGSEGRYAPGAGVWRGAVAAGRRCSPGSAGCRSINEHLHAITDENIVETRDAKDIRSETAQVAMGIRDLIIATE